MGIMDKITKVFTYDEETETEGTQTSFEQPTPTKKIKNIENNSGTKAEFVVVRPERFDESIQIGSYLLERKTVVLNLESTGKETSRRIVDFLSGVAFALSGAIKKVSLATYLITPTNAEITGDNVDDFDGTGMFL